MLWNRFRQESVKNPSTNPRHIFLNLQTMSWSKSLFWPSGSRGFGIEGIFRVRVHGVVLNTLGWVDFFPAKPLSLSHKKSTAGIASRHKASSAI